MINKAIQICLVLILVLAAWFCEYGASTGYAQAPASDQGMNLTELSRTIDESIAAEKASVESFKEQLDILKREKLFFAAAFNGYQLRVSTYENLLLTSGVALATFQKARNELQASINEVRNMIAEISPRANIISVAKTNISQQKNLNKRQLRELLKINAPASYIDNLKSRTRELSGLLSRKEKFLDQLDKITASRLDQLDKLDKGLSGIAFKIKAMVDQLEEQHIFERRKGLFSYITRSALETEWGKVKNEVAAVFQPEQELTDLRRFWRTSGNILIAFLVLLAVLIILLKRMVCQAINTPGHALVLKLGPYHQMAVRVLNSLFFITGIALLIFIYSYLDVLYVSTAALQFSAAILFVLIFARFLRLILNSWAWKPAIPDETLARLTTLITLTKYFCWFYILVGWSLGKGSILLLLIRISFELFLIGWALNFWRRRPFGLKSEPEENQNRRPMVIAFKAISYLVGGAALIMDLIGYGPLAVLWLASWGRSIVVIFCWIGFYMMLQEWDHHYREKSVSGRNELLHDEYPWQWLMIRIGQLACALSLVTVLIFAWGGQRSVLLNIHAILGYPLKIGNMTFSFLGLIYTILIFLATHGIARLWRWMFQHKFLSRSGMAIGLQDSITTVTVYCIWVLGILIAMHVFGLNTATMAVAFGGLGIGLGFGLQNIFNNFISGIILLFERPIQVGMMWKSMAPGLSLRKSTCVPLLCNLTTMRP